MRQAGLAAASLAVVVALAAPALAQPSQDIPRLAPVVVTPSRIEERASDTPASVTVIGGDAVRNAPQQTVDNLLRHVPSFSLFRRSSSLVTHPTAQGVSLRGIRPSGASRALVLQDEVLGPLRFSLEGMLFDTDGYKVVKASRRGRIDEEADLHAGVGTARVELVASPDLTLFATGGYFGEERHNGTALQENDTQLGHLFTGGTLRTADGSQWRLTLWTQAEGFHSTFSAQAGNRNSETLALTQRSPSTTAGGTLQWNRAVGDHGLLAGVDTHWVVGETDENVFAAGRFLRNRVAGGEQLFAGVFAQDAWKVTPWLELTGALRGDWWRAYNGFHIEEPPPAGVPGRQAFRAQQRGLRLAPGDEGASTSPPTAATGWARTCRATSSITHRRRACTSDSRTASRATSSIQTSARVGRARSSHRP